MADWQLLNTPAPPGWEELLDPTRTSYSKNVVTAEISQQHPCDFYFQQLLRERAALLAQVCPTELLAFAGQPAELSQSPLRLNASSPDKRKASCSCVVS